MKVPHYLLAASLLLSASAASAQDDGKGKDKKDKDKKEYKDKDKDYKDRDDRDKDYKDRDKDLKDRDKDRDKDLRERDKDRDKDLKERDKDRDSGYRDRDDDRNRNGRDGRNDGRPVRTGGGRGGILGRVMLPQAGTPGPRELAGVPRGHYPPPGECRVWYPNRPPGQQPPATSCDRLAGARLEPGAFILHGDRAYDAEYNWREEERRRPGTVGRDILDILLPRR